MVDAVLCADCNKTRRVRAPVSLSASYTSTLAEEIIALLRALHALDDWNAHVNGYMYERMGRTVELLVEKPRTLTVRTMYSYVPGNT